MTAQAATNSTIVDALRERVAGKNINAETLLATDYLNHFSEVIMILEMSTDMPDMLEEVSGWTPLSYEEHFRGSGLGDAELMIEGYIHSPPEYRIPFDAAVAELIEDIKSTLGEAAVLLDEGGDPVIYQSLIESAIPELHKAVDIIAAIVNTDGDAHNQDAVDAIFDDQTAVDALFDDFDSV